MILAASGCRQRSPNFYVAESLAEIGEILNPRLGDVAFLAIEGAFQVFRLVDDDLEVDGSTVLDSNSCEYVWVLASGAGALTVEMFGAVGDGATDDTDAFNLAVASIPLGSVLYGTAGRTYVLDNWVISRDVSFDFTGSILLHAPSATNHMIRASVPLTGSWTAGTLDGNKANQDVDANWFSLFYNYSDGFQFRKTTFRNFMQAGILDYQSLGDLSTIFVRFLEGYSLLESALKANAGFIFAPGLAGGAPHVWVESCTFRNNAAPAAGSKACGGFYMAGSDANSSYNSLTFKDNILKRVGDDHVPGPGPNHYGIAALDLYEDTYYAEISGNKIDTYYIGAKLQNCHNLKFHHNEIRTTGLVGIDYCPGERLQTAEYSNGKITENTVEASTAAVGIYIRAGASGGWHEVLVDGNTIKECLKGIVVNGQVGLTAANEGYGPLIISNNFLWSNGGNGIEIFYTQADISVHNNYINVIGSGGITALTGNTASNLKIAGNTVLLATTGFRAVRVWGVNVLTITGNLLAAADAGSIAVEIDADAAANKVQKLIYSDNIVQTGTVSIDTSDVVVYEGQFRVVASDSTVAVNSGAAETDLCSLTIPANTLNRNGDTLEFEGGGFFEGSANNKRLRVYLGAVTLYDSFSYAVPTRSSFRVSGVLTRASAAVTNGTTELRTELASGMTPITYATSALDLTTPLVLRVTGLGGVNGDVVLGFIKVKVVGIV